MGNELQTVLILAGTGTTKKFSGGLFRGVKSYFGGTGTTIFLVGDRQTVLHLGGTGTTEFLGGL